IFFQESDDLLGKLLTKITPEAYSIEFTHEEKYQLSLITMLQTLRTKAQRQSIADFSSILKSTILEWQGKDMMPTISPEHVKFMSLSNLQNAPELADILNKKSLVLMKAPVGHYFWISDSPVVLHNHDKTKK